MDEWLDSVHCYIPTNQSIKVLRSRLNAGESRMQRGFDQDMSVYVQAVRT